MGMVPRHIELELGLRLFGKGNFKIEHQSFSLSISISISFSVEMATLSGANVKCLNQERCLEPQAASSQIVMPTLEPKIILGKCLHLVQRARLLHTCTISHVVFHQVMTGWCRCQVEAREVVASCRSFATFAAYSAANAVWVWSSAESCHSLFGLSSSDKP